MKLVFILPALLAVGISGYLSKSHKPVATGPEVYMVENEVFVNVTEKARIYGTAFNYQGHLITAGHVCFSSTTDHISIVDPYTRHMTQVKIQKIYEQEDVCVLEPLSSGKHLEFLRATELSTEVISKGYAKTFYYTETKLHYLTSMHISLHDILGGAMTPYEDAYEGAIISGMSGGPVVDLQGHLVGLNSAGNGVLSFVVSTDVIDQCIARANSRVK